MISIGGDYFVGLYFGSTSFVTLGIEDFRTLFVVVLLMCSMVLYL